MLRNFTKFTLKGVAGIVVNTIILLVLTRYLFNSYFTTYILAPSISSEVSILFTYIICYSWIWNNRVHNNKRDFFRRIPGYNATACISFGVKIALLITIERIFHFDVVICNLLAILVSGLINFLAGEKIIFKEIKQQYSN
ncbi:MAG: GtrA family protein [Candidatus Marinimicrobia bacterium]|nr:GtrA family protein [Candidatus Neomarinimicrobiota bacterium]